MTALTPAGGRKFIFLIKEVARAVRVFPVRTTAFHPARIRLAGAERPPRAMFVCLYCATFVPVV